MVQEVVVVVVVGRWWWIHRGTLLDPGYGHFHIFGRFLNQMMMKWLRVSLESRSLALSRAHDSDD